MSSPAARSSLDGGAAPWGAYEPLVSRPPATPRFRRRTWLLRGIGLCVLLGAFLATVLTIGRRDNLHRVLLWIHLHPGAGFVIFALLYVWFTVLFLPPALLAACAGAIYGLGPAVPLVWACAVLGETVSFLLGRFLLKKWVAELTADWPMWVALNAALREDGWKLVALLRLSPVMPFSVINYALGSSSLPFSHYFWPSVAGVVPGLILYIWLGSLAADVTEAISSGSTAAPPAAKIAIIVTGAVSALLVVVLSAVYTKRAIDRRLASVAVHEQVVVEQQHRHLLADGDGDGGGGGAGAASRSVLVSVETPLLLVDGAGPWADGGRKASGSGSGSGGGGGGSGGGGVSGVALSGGAEPGRAQPGATASDGSGGTGRLGWLRGWRRRGRSSPGAGAGAAAAGQEGANAGTPGEAGTSLTAAGGGEMA